MNAKQKLVVNYHLLKCAGALPKSSSMDKESAFILSGLARLLPKALPFLARRLPALAKFVGRFAPTAIRAGERVVPSFLDRMIGRSGRYARNFLTRATTFKNVPALLPRGARWLNTPLARKGFLSNFAKGDLLFLNPTSGAAWGLYRYPKTTLALLGGSKLLNSILPPAPTFENSPMIAGEPYETIDPAMMQAMMAQRGYYG